MNAGKGDKPRPINKKEYDLNFEKIIWQKNHQKNNIIVSSKAGKKTFKY